MFSALGSELSFGEACGQNEILVVCKSIGRLLVHPFPLREG